jgi:voltage-gated potassium channel
VNHPKPLVRATAAILAVLVIGTVGYNLIEGWSLLDGFYMTVITISTIGYREIHEMSNSGVVFTIFIIFIGVGTMGYALVAGTAMLIEGELKRLLTRRRSMKALSRIKNHFIVCGFGRMGSFICDEFHLRGIPFVVVESNPSVQDKILQVGYYLSAGNATEEETLMEAGIKSARGLVSVLNSDAENVYVVLTARELNPKLDIVARADEEGAQKKLVRAGASRVVSPYKIGGMRMVMGILKPEVMNFLEVAMDHRQLDLELEEVFISEDSVYASKELVETDLRRELNLIIIAVKKTDGRMVFNPGPHTVIEAGDMLIAMGERAGLTIFEKKAHPHGRRPVRAEI